jgi:phage gpG-like protein
MGLDIRSMREPLKRSIQQVIAPSFGQNFVSMGRPEGWQQLSDATLMNKTRYNYPDDILVRTGLLRKTIQQLNIWTISRTEATIQGLPDKIAYGVYHQTGTTNMPARPFAVLQDEDIDKIQEIFADWMLERAMAHVGLGAL